MSGSMPEPEVVTASTGMSWTVRPGLYGPSSLRIAWTLALTAFASAGSVGPRFANVVPAALYAGVVPDGRSWKYLALVNDWAESLEPTTFPFEVIRLPFALFLNVACAKPVIRAGYPIPKTTVRTTVATRAPLRL